MKPKIDTEKIGVNKDWVDTDKIPFENVYVASATKLCVFLRLVFLLNFGQC